MFYVDIVCFILGVVLVFRSLFGYEELKSSRVRDRIILSLLWLNITFHFLISIVKHIGS